MTPAEMVREFHKAFGLVVRDEPTLPDSAERELRAALIREEASEVLAELEAPAVKRISTHIADVASELADLVYVVYGAALHYGVDLDAVVAEVHRANMSKMVDGRPMYREDGKVLKGPDFRRADVAKVLGL